MTNLNRLCTVVLGLGILGASACSSCMQQPTDTSSAVDPNLGAHSYTCGKNTHLVGNQCVGDNVTTQGAKPRQPLSTTGNN